MTIAEISKNVDRIVVDNREYKKVAHFWNGKSSTEILNKKMFFPLKTFVISIELTKTTTITALVELDGFNPTSGRITTDFFDFSYKRDFLKGGTEFQGHYHGYGSGIRAKQFFSDTHAYIVSVLVYICIMGRELTVKQRQERKEKGGDIEIYNPYEYKDRECFLLNQIIRYVGDHPTRKSIKYQCECWGVRGHIRHMSSGQVQFVHPYKKGRKRDILEPKSKTYLLENGKGESETDGNE